MTAIAPGVAKRIVSASLGLYQAVQYSRKRTTPGPRLPRGQPRMGRCRRVVPPTQRSLSRSLRSRSCGE